MNPALIIARKRDGHALCEEDIAAFVSAYANGGIPDYQMAALAMAIYLRGMNAAETTVLTQQMLGSGTTLSWSTTAPPRVDKHSTGGIGDKVSLILAPLLACCGLRVPMISGRGLGATGGTLDKLESIPGFRTDLTVGEIREITERVGCVITGATADLAPADKKLYALRDVTATVASIPLITASILSKKLAENLDALVLDVKFGSGAFMKTSDEARALAASLVSVATRMGVKTSALLTDMNQPLGRMIGNAVEVNESITTLSGAGPADLRQLVLALGAELLVLTQVEPDLKAATVRLEEQIASGAAREKFHEMVAAQGGDQDAEREVAPCSMLTATRGGYVSSLDAEQLGLAIIEMGGGRKLQTDSIDHSVGLEMLVRLGEPIAAGQALIRIFAHADTAASVRSRLHQAVVIGDAPPPPVALIADRVTAAACG